MRNGQPENDDRSRSGDLLSFIKSHISFFLGRFGGTQERPHFRVLLKVTVRETERDKGSREGYKQMSSDGFSWEVLVAAEKKR